MPDLFRAALLDWYDEHRRDLPWRRTRDPYAIWVSEVMLQQTRVDTVIPYYERFLARFPDAAALASASEDAVLAEWSGLGYYRRARLLRAGAREVVERHEGRVPLGRAERLGLPGVGRYTAGAIGSIAFDLPEPVVDGNVARVLCRIRLLETPLGRADTGRRLWEEAERLVRGDRPGALNQALMELGATLCAPSNPRCDECPVAQACEARRRGMAGHVPVRTPRRAPRLVELSAAIALRRGREVWLVRGEDRLFGGLLSLPLEERRQDSAEAARRALEATGASASVEAEPIAEIAHVLSHRRLEIALHRARVRRLRAGHSGRWVQIDALFEFGLSALTMKLLEAAGVHPALPRRSRRQMVGRGAGGGSAPASMIGNSLPDEASWKAKV